MSEGAPRGLGATERGHQGVSGTPPDSSVHTAAILGTRGYPSYYGGFETAVRKLAPFLTDHGWQVAVYSRRGAVKMDDPQRDSRVESRFTAGIDSTSLSTLSYGFTSALNALTRRPDVALIMNVANCLWLPLLRMRRIPTAVNVDGIEWERKKWNNVAKATFRLGARLAARWADTIIVDSLAIGDVWRDVFGREGRFIPYGGESVEPMRPVMGLSSGSYALLVCRFVPENSVDAFLDACTLIPPEVPIVLVGAAGEGDILNARAAQLAEERPNTRWLGRIEDDELLLSLWSNCGVYFHGHTVGGTNPALVQAMAAGAPTVAVDTRFNREVLADSGIFVRAQAAEIARSLISVLGNTELRQALSAGARRRASVEYTWDRVNASYEECLRDLLPLSDRDERARRNREGRTPA